MSTLYHSKQPIPNTSGIYRITCHANDKIYIGSALNLRKRRKEHFGTLQRNEHRNPKMQHAWNKYGSEAFSFEILELILIPEMLIIREQHWFDTLRPFDKRGFNINRVAGSSLGRVVSQASREKSRATQLGRPSTRVGWHPTPEAVERQRRSLTGYKHTEETKRNMGNARRGKKHTEETREKIRIANLGHDVSPETGAKISAANTGRNHSDQARLKMSITGSTRKRSPEEYASRRKTLILTDPNGTEYIVNGIYEFCIEHNLDGSAIAKVAKGKYKHHRGWTARYPDPTES